MSKVFKKFILSFLAICMVFFTVAPNFMIAKAAPTPTSPPEGNWYNSSFGNWYDKVYDNNVSPDSEIFGERYTAAQVQWVIYSLFAFVLNAALGSSNQQIVSCMMTNTTDISSCMQILKNMISQKPNQTKLASSHTQPSLISLVFADRPMSGISYVRDKIQNFSLVQPVHAAASPGFGFDALQPVQNLWAAVRNISFALFVIAMVVFAFMIMFRIKLSPQTVITVQSAIPKVAITLILVTFSYAIAGFLIDLMYVVIGLISVAFGSMGGMLSGTPSQAFMYMTQGQASGLNVNFGILLLGILYIFFFTFGFLILLFYNMGLLGFAVTSAAVAGIYTLFAPVLNVLLPIVGILLLIAIVGIILWNFIRTMWNLLKAFANIILLTIFAPLQITAGLVIPNLGFGSWIKSFVSNLSVFVVTGALLFFSFVFLGEGFTIGVSQFSIKLGNALFQFLLGVGASSAINPNISSAGWPPLLGGGNSSSGVGLLLMGVSFVLFTMIPKATELVQSFLSGKPFAYGSAVGEALAPASMLWGQTGGAYLGDLSKMRRERMMGNVHYNVAQSLEDVSAKNPRATRVATNVGIPTFNEGDAADQNAFQTRIDKTLRRDH